MSESDEHHHGVKDDIKKMVGSVEDNKRRTKGYTIIVLTAVTFILLMFVSTAGTLYFAGQSIDPNVISTVENASQHHLSTLGWQILSAVIVGINAIISVLAFRVFRKWFRMHNENLAYKDNFRPKLLPIASMGFVVAFALGILGAMIGVTHTTLHGLDPVSIYYALESGSIYGILSVLIALPLVGIIIAYLGPKTYHYVEDWEKRHGVPDIPERKKDTPTGSTDTSPK